MRKCPYCDHYNSLLEISCFVCRRKFDDKYGLFKSCNSCAITICKLHNTHYKYKCEACARTKSQDREVDMLDQKFPCKKQILKVKPDENDGMFDEAGPDPEIQRQKNNNRRA